MDEPALRSGGRVPCIKEDGQAPAKFSPRRVARGETGQTTGRNADDGGSGLCASDEGAGMRAAFR